MFVSRSKNKKNLIKILESFFLIKPETNIPVGPKTPAARHMLNAKSSSPYAKQHAPINASYNIEVYVNPIALAAASATKIKVNAYSIQPDVDFSFKGNDTNNFNKAVLCFDRDASVKLRTKNNLLIGSGESHLSQVYRKHYQSLPGSSRNSSKNSSSFLVLRKNAASTDYSDDGTISPNLQYISPSIIKMVTQDIDLGCMQESQRPLLQGPISLATSSEAREKNSRTNNLKRISRSTTRPLRMPIPHEGIEERLSGVPRLSRDSGAGSLNAAFSNMSKEDFLAVKGNITRGSTSSQNMVRVKSDLKYSAFHIPFTFKLRYNDIITQLGNIYIEFLVTNDNDSIIERHIKRVSSRVIEPETKKIIAPRISASRIDSRRIRVAVSQLDPVADRVLIQKSTSSAEDYLIGRNKGFSELKTVSASATSGQVEFTDVGNTVGYVTYRAFAITPSGGTSTDLSEITISPGVSTTDEVPRVKDITRAVVANMRVIEPMKEEGSTIFANVKGIVRSVRMFYVLSTANGRTTDINSKKIYIQPDNDQDRQGISDNREINFLHPASDIKSGRVYEYFIEVIRENGTVEVIKPSIKHKYNVLQKEVGIDFSVTKSPAGRGASFDISASFKSDSIDIIVDSLKKSGAFESFLSDIENNRDRFSSLFKVLITRTNVTAVPNETYTFKLSDANLTFVDPSYTNNNTGIPICMPGCKYIYRFELFVSQFSTLLDRVEIEKQDPQTLQIIKDISDTFANNMTKERSELPSARKRVGTKDAGVDNVFTSNSTGKVITKDMSIPDIPFKIENLRAKKIKDDNIMLTWTSSGNQEKVSSFKVFCDYNGIKAPIGDVAYSSTSSKNMEYIDDKMSLKVGKKVYTVAPVFYDLSTGKESGPAVVNTFSSLSTGEEERREDSGKVQEKLATITTPSFGQLV